MSSRLRHHLDNSKEEELKLLPKHHDTDYVSFSSHANGEELDDQTESHFFGDNDAPEAVQAEAIDSSARGPSFYGAIAVLSTHISICTAFPIFTLNPNFFNFTPHDHLIIDLNLVEYSCCHDYCSTHAGLTSSTNI